MRINRGWPLANDPSLGGVYPQGPQAASGTPGLSLGGGGGETSLPAPVDHAPPAAEAPSSGGGEAAREAAEAQEAKIRQEQEDREQAAREAQERQEQEAQEAKERQEREAQQAQERLEYAMNHPPIGHPGETVTYTGPPGAGGVVPNEHRTTGGSYSKVHS